jgi:hypothetical protein
MKPFLVVTLCAIVLLYPDTSTAALVQCEIDCGSCDLVLLANAVIKWLIGILFLVFAVLMTIAGWGLVTSGGNQAALSAAKEKFKNALIGIIVVLAAWLLVDTLLRSLLNPGGALVYVNPDGSTSTAVAFGPWNEMVCLRQEQTLEGTINTTALPVEAGSPAEGFTLDPTVPANEGMVRYAREMQAAGCVYNQNLRNGCRGNPGYTDCSDLVANARAANGLPPRGTNTRDMHRPENSVELTPAVRAGLQPGDAIVYRRPDGTGHVVVCEDAGCSRVIHARGQAHGIQSTGSSPHLNHPGARVLRRD